MAHLLVAGEPKQPILHERAAHGETAFILMKGSAPEISAVTQVVKERGRGQVSAASVVVAVPMKGVGSGLRDDVQDYSAGLTVLGVVVVGQHLEFLHLFNRGAQSVAGRNDLIGYVASVDVHLYTAVVNGARPDEVARKAGQVLLDPRRDNGETRVVIRDTTDSIEAGRRWKRGDLLFINDVGYIGLGGFNQRRRGADVDDFRLAGDR